MRLRVALPAGTVRFWVAAAAPALAVILGAYLLETHGRTSAAAALVAGGVAIAAGRFLASRRADRRYAKVLESEVATQTRSLMDSLAATAGAERNLRLVMDAVPDAIAVLDRDGRIMDLNEAAKRMVAAPPGEGAGRSVFEFLDADAATTVRGRLAAASAGRSRASSPSPGISPIRNTRSSSCSRRRSSPPWDSSSAAWRTRSTTRRRSFPDSRRPCCSTR